MNVQQKVCLYQQVAGSVLCVGEGRDVKSQRRNERGEERWTEVRIETSFHLASLMAAMIVCTTKDNDSNRTRGGDGGGGLGRYYFHSDAFSYAGVVFGRPRHQDCHHRQLHKQNHSKNKFNRRGLII